MFKRGFGFRLAFYASAITDYNERYPTMHSVSTFQSPRGKLCKGLIVYKVNICKFGACTPALSPLTFKKGFYKDSINASRICLPCLTFSFHFSCSSFFPYSQILSLPFRTHFLTRVISFNAWRFQCFSFSTSLALTTHLTD